MFEDISRFKPRARQRPLGEILAVGGEGNGAAAHDPWLRLAIKRGIDIGFALLALLALWLPILALCLIFRRALVQIPTRGRHGKVFTRINFSFPSGDFARFMRDSGLSRLPELINLLKGDMSLVGPFPNGGARAMMRPGLIGCDDADYARKFSLRGDLAIAFSAVLGRRH